MTQQQVEIINRLGLHARAAAKLVHTANGFRSQVYVGTGEEEVNAKSILGLLTLAATKGTPLMVRAEGEDEEEAVRAVVALFADRFGEGE
ncbi:MAG: HPr family phosphocarrier protein [Holophagae bacterium]|nr:MAG: HPr family phosphocarrier protein [Holophagae bacterium]